MMKERDTSSRGNIFANLELDDAFENRDSFQESLSDFRGSVPVTEPQDFDAIRQKVFSDAYRMDER